MDVNGNFAQSLFLKRVLDSTTKDKTMIMLVIGKRMLINVNVRILVIVIMYPPTIAPRDLEREPIEPKMPNIVPFSFFGTTSDIYADPMN